MSTAKKTIATMLREAADKLDSKKPEVEKGKKIEMAAQGKLENGQMIATPADEWAEGVEVFVVPDEGEPFPLAPGDYTLDNGAKMTVAEEGIVNSIESGEGSPEGGEGGEGEEMKKNKDGEKKEFESPKIKAVVESIIREQKFASQEKLEELSKQSKSQEDLMVQQTELITKLSEQISDLKKPVEMREQKTKKKERPAPPSKPLADMSNSERATYLREQYNS